MSAKINPKLALLLAASLLLMPFANALTVNDFFQNFYGLVENQYAFYTIMFLVTFIFLFSIFFALSKSIPFFKGSGGNVGPAGQIFALSLSAIATLSLFSYVQGRGGAGYASGFFTNRVGSLGIWGWILLALLILAVVFFALRKHGKGILGEGDFDANLKKLTALLWVLSFILVMYGSISKNRTITTIGAVLFVIALILTILTGGFKFGKEGEPEPPHPPPVPPEPPEGYGTIYGVVSDRVTGREIPHVRIECAGYAPVIADTGGNYSITVPIGQHVLAAAKQDYNNYRSNPIQVASKARIEHNFEMESSSAEKGTIEGNVVVLSEFQQGHEVGVEGATVKLYTLDQDNQPRILNIRPQVSENGKFSFKDLSLPMTNIVVYAEKEGKWNTHMGGSWPNQVRGRPDHLISLGDRNKEEKNVLVVLDVLIPPTQMGYIEGKVVYKDDRGNEISVVKDAIVHLYDWNTKQPFPNINPKNSDENGKFKFENLPLPMVQIAVYVQKEESGNIHWRNGRPSGPINLTITPDHKKEEDVLVALNAPRIQTGFIEGKVLNFDEHQQGREVGVNKAKVYLEKRQGTFLNIITFSDEDGNFKFENLQLPMSDILVVTYKDDLDGSRGSSNHMIKEGKPDHYINLTINRPEERGVVIYLEGPRQKGKIKGKVVDVTNIMLDGQPAPILNSQVALEKVGEHSQIFRNTTNGEYIFDNLPFGTYIVYGRATNCESVDGNSRTGKHTDQPGGNPPTVITINDTHLEEPNVVVPLKRRGAPPPGPTELPNIKVELDSQTIQKLTAGDKCDRLVFKINNDGGKARVRLFVNLYKNYENYVTDQDYQELRASRQVREIDADQWQLKIKRLIRGDFTEVRENNSRRLMELTMAKGTMVQIEFEIPKNAQGIYHIQLTAAALKPGNREYYTEGFGHDTKWYIIEVIRKGIEKEIKKEKKEHIEIKRKIAKDMRNKSASASIIWKTEFLEDLDKMIIHINRQIKIIKDANEELYNTYVKNNHELQGNFDTIKKIYTAHKTKNQKELEKYRTITYKGMARTIDLITEFLSEIIKRISFLEAENRLKAGK